MKNDSYVGFGDFPIFSILLMLDEQPCGTWMNGYLYICINNRVLGNNSMVSLRDAMYELECFVESSNDRVNDSLFSVDYEHMFNVIDSSAYDGDNDLSSPNDIYNYISDNEFAGSFIIKPHVQSMSGIKIFSVTNSMNISKVVFKIDDGEINCLLIDNKIMQETFERAHQYLKEKFKYFEVSEGFV